MMNAPHLQILSAVFGMLFLISSCSHNPSTINKKAPTLPPANSLEMDFSTFDHQQNMDEQTSGNFVQAAATVFDMNTVAELNMMIPKKLLAAANNADAQLNENHQWEWNYIYSAGEDSYSVQLMASHKDGNRVSWNFYVTSSELGLNNQLLISGTSDTNGNEGTWSYHRFENANSQEKISEINWKVMNEEGQTELRLEVISDRNDKEGDYIEYTAEKNLKTAVYYDNSADETTELQINAENKIGYYISPNYNEGKQSCWNHQLQDIACGEL